MSSTKLETQNSSIFSDLSIQSLNTHLNSFKNSSKSTLKDTVLGLHLIIELFDCDPQKISDVECVEKIMIQAAKATRATIVDVVFHTFNPQGVSGVVVIAESHLSIHTWPEYCYAAVDIFTCGETTDPWRADPVLKTGFKAKHMKVLELKRGILQP